MLAQSEFLNDLDLDSSSDSISVQEPDALWDPNHPDAVRKTKWTELYGAIKLGPKIYRQALLSADVKNGRKELNKVTKISSLLINSILATSTHSRPGSKSC
jgi:hypothetical protein